MPSNRRALTESVAHQVKLLRFATKVGRDAVSTLNAADDELLAFLGRRLRDLLRATPAVQAEMRHSLGLAVEEINSAAYEDVEVSVLHDMADLIRYEEEFQSGLLTRAGGREIVVELDPQVREAILDTPIMGRSIDEQLEDAAAARLVKVQKAIGEAVATGARPQEALDLIEGTEEQQWRDGAMQGAREWLETLGITDVAGVADLAGREVYEDSGIVVQEAWISVLDPRTTPLCRSQDGATRKLGQREWSTGYSGPFPGHWGCRSVIIPLVSDEPLDKVTYPEWLAEQSEETQIDVLGPTRFKLWKAGRLPLTRHVTDRGRPLTIEQLRSMEAAAFKRAGLDAA